MNNIVTILKGIVLILSSLFVLGIADTSWEELPAWGLFLSGILVSLVGFHNHNIDKK